MFSLMWIMPPRVMTRSAGRPAAASRGRGTGGRAGRGGGRTRAQVGDQGRGQGNVRNQNCDAINDNTRGDVRNFIENNDRRGCTYKEFLACNPKKCDGKGGAVVYTRWIEKMESVQDMSGCGDNQKVKYTVGSFVGKALTWWNYHIRTLGREVAVGMSWDNFKVLMREEFFPSIEMQKMETQLWNHAMVGAGYAAYTDRFHELARLVPHLVTPKSKRIERTGNAFATTTNPVGRENAGTVQKCTTCNSYHASGAPCRTCFNCNRPGHFAKDCRVVPRNVNPVNVRNPTAACEACFECGSLDHYKLAYPRLIRAQGPGGNRPNQALVNDGGQGRGNHRNQVRGKAFMLGAEEAR
ncbi:reverse transcriptase domain-containing protein [Tanacetum coccineum]